MYHLLVLVVSSEVLESVCLLISVGNLFSAEVACVIVLGFCDLHI